MIEKSLATLINGIIAVIPTVSNKDMKIEKNSSTNKNSLSLLVNRLLNLLIKTTYPFIVFNFSYQILILARVLKISLK